MPLDINNETYRQFIQFAQTSVDAGKERAVARLNEKTELGGIVKRTIKPTSGDWVGVGAGRLASLKKANNTTRAAFLKAVGDMFGGADHIPESVKQAMKMEDYGKGKPLTARRIMAVKAVVDAEIEILLNKFDTPDAEGAAKGKGWTADELPKVARAAHFLSAITDEDELASIDKLSTAGTKENRLLKKGGDFLKSLDAFRDGLRRIEAEAPAEAEGPGDAVQGLRAQLKADLARPANYADMESRKAWLPPEKLAFTFKFPGEKPIATNGTGQGGKNIDTVIDKIEKLCGKVHPAQTASVMRLVSQSALDPLNGGLSLYGIDTTEHAACDFTLSRNDRTGAVTIRYASPEGLPFAFGWTATVGPDGSMKSTPLQFIPSEEPVKDAALEAGYHKSELPRIAKAFKFIRLATGCGEAEATKRALDPFSRERRLFDYGGRFADSVDDFKKGLALMKKFEGWYMNVVDTIEKNRDNLGDVDNPTVRNAFGGYFAKDTVRAYEKFLFEELGANVSMPLDADDPEKAFGMESNAATRFVGRGLTSALNDAVAKMPVEVRQILFAVFDAMLPLATDAAGRKEVMAACASVATFVIARVMVHLDDFREMQNSGTLTDRNVKELLFPDVPDAGKKSLKANTDEIERQYADKFKTDGVALTRVFAMLESSGRTLEEVYAAEKDGRTLPPAPYIRSTTGRLNDVDGTANGARKAAVLDLKRPASPVNGRQERILSREHVVFTVRFPDQTVLQSGVRAKEEENERDATVIVDKIAELVGDKHQVQLAAVLMGLTQSAHGPFRNNSGKLGFYDRTGAEHSPLTYTLSRNEETGAITIRYSEPEGFPSKFHWETTIALDGTSSTTPLVVDEPPSQVVDQPPQVADQPQVVEQQPPAAEQQPQAAEQPPQAVEQPPQAVEQPPQAVDQPPQAAEQPPQVAGQPQSAAEDLRIPNVVDAHDAYELVASGTSPAAEQFRRRYENLPAPAGDAPLAGKKDSFIAGVNEAARKQIVSEFTSQICKHLVTAESGGPAVEHFEEKGFEHGLFARDLKGRMQVRLGGLGDIAGDYPTARDQLVQFITGDAKATFEKAGKSEKRQALLLMNLVSQDIPTCAQIAFTEGIGELYMTGAPMGQKGDRRLHFSLTRTADGGIGIELVQRIPVGTVTLESGTYMVNPDTGRMDVKLKTTLPAGELKRVADLDWKKFDVAKFRQASQKQTTAEQLALIPPEYMLNATVESSVHFHLDNP